MTVKEFGEYLEGLKNKVLYFKPAPPKRGNRISLRNSVRVSRRRQQNRALGIVEESW